jgi:sarcosine oxidase gamma subunit
MKSIAIAALILASAAAHAFGAQAFLVGQRVGTSMTGQPVTVCIYQYGAQKFEMTIRGVGFCQQSVAVE